MFTVIGDIFTCILWGTVISILLTGMLFYIPKAISTRYSYSPIYLLLLLITLGYFLFQTTLLMGGFKMKKYTTDIEQITRTYLQANPSQLNNMAGQLNATCPGLEKYVNSATEALAGQSDKLNNPAAFTAAFNKAIRLEINLYIWRRIGWTATGLLLIGLLLIRDANRQEKSQNTRRRLRHTTY